MTITVQITRDQNEHKKVKKNKTKLCHGISSISWKTLCKWQKKWK